MSKDRLMRIDSTEYQDMIQRVLRATKLTSRLNVLPFEDEAGKGEMFEQILGRPLAPNTTIYPPFYTDHGLRLELGEHVFINQNVRFWTMPESGWAIE
jgi:acetyltransferase-like isoleucine patch superfamily enzyme